MERSFNSWLLQVCSASFTAFVTAGELALAEKIKLLKEYRLMGISTLKGEIKTVFLSFYGDCTVWELGHVAAELFGRLKVSRQNIKARKTKAIRKLLKMDVHVSIDVECPLHLLEFIFFVGIASPYE